MKLTPLMRALVPALLAGQTQAAPTELGKGEGQLNIVAWAGYVERGETDKNYDWVTGFEKETGCKVSVKTAATSDEMVALMNEGGFDLVTASGDASLRLIAGGKVQALNLALIPSYSKIDPPAAKCPLAHCGWQALRRALPVGRQYPDVQHQGVPQGTGLLERGVRGADPGGWQVQQGAGAGL